MMTPSNDLIYQILNQGPSQSSIHIILSHLMGEGQNAAVMQGCLKALDLYPDDIRLRQLLAEAYLRLGFIGQAETELCRVTDQISDLTGSYKTLAKLYLHQQRVVEAQRLLQLYCLHRPEDLEAAALLAGFPTEKPETEPEEVSEAASEADVLIQLATPTLAEIYFKQGQIEEAIRTYEKVLARNPHDERLIQRLNELKGTSQGSPEETGDAAVAGASPIEINQRMISVLEGWLTRIRELKHGRA